jgi:transcriptional regulator with XRE-family HTH domain
MSQKRNIKYEIQQRQGGIYEVLQWLIKFHRIRDNLMMEEFGNYAGLSTTQVWRLEHKKQNLNIEILVKLSRALRVEVIDIWDHSLQTIKEKYRHLFTTMINDSAKQAEQKSDDPCEGKDR